MSFEQISLTEAVKFIVDNRGKTVPIVAKGFPLIATNCISNQNLYPEFVNVRYVSDEIYRTWFRSHPEPGDIIITNKGSQNGAICLVPDPVTFCIAQDMVAVRANEEIIYPKYLFATLRSPGVQAKIKELNVDSVIPHFKKTDFNKLYLPLLSYEKQKFVGDLYFSFSSKIELNRQINQTLEQIAQAMFKSWFVDFEPTRAKIAAKEAGGDQAAIEQAAMCAISGKITDQLAQLPPETLAQLKATAALFPDALVDSELGEIPEGWEVKSFGDVSNCFDSKRVPLSKPQREKRKPGDYPYYGATSVMDYVNEWIFDGIYLLLGEDGSVVREDGTPFTQYVWGKVWVNNHAHVLQGKDSVSTEHLMLFIQAQNIVAYITGAVQQKLNQGNMNSIPFIFAGRQINEVFFQSIQSLYAQIRTLSAETQRLGELRDLLLPKLLSGDHTITESPTNSHGAT